MQSGCLEEPGLPGIPSFSYRAGAAALHGPGLGRRLRYAPRPKRVESADDMTSAERTRNPFTSSARGGQLLSAAQLPFFLARPPAAYGVLTTTGRKTGKKRRRCIRAVRNGETVYLVAIKGSAKTGWVRNAVANPDVKLRLPGGSYSGRARLIARLNDLRHVRHTPRRLLRSTT